MNYSADNEVLYWLLNDPQRDYWEKFQELLKGQNPFEVAQGALFEIVKEFRATDKLPVFAIIEEQVRTGDSGQSFAARIAVEELRTYKGEKDLFYTSLQVVRDKWLERATLSSVKTAMEIVVSGVQLGRDKLKGVEDAWSYLGTQKQKISDVRDSSVSSGDMLLEAKEIWRDYQVVKDDPSKLGRISTGIKVIDEATGGFAGGEFWIVGAFVGECKSTLLRNMAYSMAVKDGKNCVYATAEMTRKQIRKMIVSRHSYSRKFAQGDFAHEPIPYRPIRDGKVAAHFRNKYAQDLGEQAVKRGEQAEEFLQYVLNDLNDGAETGEYGMLDVLQVPGNMTIPDLGDYLSVLNKKRRVDVVFIDYAMLFASHSKINDRHEVHAAKIRACKQLALDFGNREQLTVVSAHQITREERDEAEKKCTSKRVKGVMRKAPEDIQPYTMRALAGTAEAERSVDVALWLLMLDKYREENMIKCGMIKNREGIIARPFFLRTDLSCGFLGNMGV